MDASQLLKNFKETTGADDTTCRYYMTTYNYDVEEAITKYFENDGAVPEDFKQANQNQVPRSSDSGGIRSMSDLLGKSSKEKDDSTNDYFAGGEKSGQIVQAPKSDKEIKQEFWDKTENSDHRVDSHEPTDNTFAGSGFRLGSDAATPTTQPAVYNPVNRVVVIHFWDNGFCVDDGQFRSFQDPSNQQFLNDVTAGTVPKELEDMARQTGSKLSVDVQQHVGPYTPPPKPAVVAFSGSGQTLGRTNENAPQSPVVVQQPASTTSEVTIDESQPITSLQIRLHNGTKKVAKFNHSHTIQDVRNYIDSNFASPAYNLSTSFPPTVIQDSNKTLSELGLINSVVIQKLI